MGLAGFDDSLMPEKRRAFDGLESRGVLCNAFGGLERGVNRSFSEATGLDGGGEELMGLEP